MFPLRASVSKKSIQKQKTFASRYCCVVRRERRLITSSWNQNHWGRFLSPPTTTALVPKLSLSSASSLLCPSAHAPRPCFCLHLLQTLLLPVDDMSTPAPRPPPGILLTWGRGKSLRVPDRRTSCAHPGPDAAQGSQAAQCLPSQFWEMTFSFFFFLFLRETSGILCTSFS